MISRAGFQETVSEHFRKAHSTLILLLGSTVIGLEAESPPHATPSQNLPRRSTRGIQHLRLTSPALCVKTMQLLLLSGQALLSVKVL